MQESEEQINWMKECQTFSRRLRETKININKTSYLLVHFTKYKTTRRTGIYGTSHDDRSARYMP